MKLRIILSYLHGYSSKESKGVIFQEGMWGCGNAVLSMLFFKYSIELNHDLHSLTSHVFGIDMHTMSNIIAKKGLSAIGYEFKDSFQLIDFMENNSGCSAILLTHSNYTMRTFSIATILLFPLIPVIKIFECALSKISRHWVLLDTINEKEIVILDPFFGRILVNKKQFDKLWSKYGLIVYKI